jgi:hypothetical protein
VRHQRRQRTFTFDEWQSCRHENSLGTRCRHQWDRQAASTARTGTRVGTKHHSGCRSSMCSGADPRSPSRALTAVIVPPTSQQVTGGD